MKSFRSVKEKKTKKKRLPSKEKVLIKPQKEEAPNKQSLLKRFEEFPAYLTPVGKRWTKIEEQKTGLASLPITLLTHIQSYLDVQSLLVCCVVCKRLYVICNLDQVWKKEVEKLLYGIFRDRVMQVFISRPYLPQHDDIEELVSKWPDRQIWKAYYFFLEKEMRMKFRPRSLQAIVLTFSLRTPSQHSAASMLTASSIHNLMLEKDADEKEAKVSLFSKEQRAVLSNFIKQRPRLNLLSDVIYPALERVSSTADASCQGELQDLRSAFEAVSNSSNTALFSFFQQMNADMS